MVVDGKVRSEMRSHGSTPGPTAYVRATVIRSSRNRSRQRIEPESLLSCLTDGLERRCRDDFEAGLLTQLRPSAGRLARRRRLEPQGDPATAGGRRIAAGPVCATSAETCASSLASARKKRASSISASAVASTMSDNTTSAPCRTNASAMAYPRPRLAPVTIAIFPSSSMNRRLAEVDRLASDSQIVLRYPLTTRSASICSAMPIVGAVAASP